MELDALDCEILALLQANARTAFAEIGRRVRLSTPSVVERVHRMEDAGVIAGYHAQVSPGAVGLPVGAVIHISVAGDKLARFAELVRRVPEVLEAHRVTGGASYIVRVAVRDTAHLETVIDSMMPYVSTETGLILASPVSWRAVTPSRSLAVKKISRRK